MIKILSFLKTVNMTNKLDILEGLLDYNLQIYDSVYLNNSKVQNIIKHTDNKKRLKFIVKKCNAKTTNNRELFLLAISYSRLGILYNERTIYYTEKYLSCTKYYNKHFKNTFTIEQSLLYQIDYFCNILAHAYTNDLMFEKALHYALKVKQLDNEFLLAEIYYKSNKLSESVLILKKALNKVQNKWEYKNLIDEIEKYESYISKKHTYKPSKKKRFRIDIFTNKIYDFNTGEIQN